MKHKIATMLIAASSALGAAAQTTDNFKYTDEKFADIQMLRYKVEGFDKLTLKEKTFIYYLQEAALEGRDILFDQNGRYNLRIRALLEAVYTNYTGKHDDKFYKALAVYLKRVWFSSGIHHHYGCEKFLPDFTEQELRNALNKISADKLPLNGQSLDAFCNELFPIIFNPEVMPMRVNQRMART